jgi:hypothetical protein
MDEMKSAFEIAMEKVAKLGEATEEERIRWKYVPEGERLAGKFINEGKSLISEIGNYPEDVRSHVLLGAESTFLNAITLPKNSEIDRANKRAMEGLKSIKEDKVTLENGLSKIRQLFNHYLNEGESQRQQAFEALKSDLEAHLRQQLKSKYGSQADRMPLEIEKQPQFGEEWRRFEAQFDFQYISHLDEYKKQLKKVK